MDDIYLSARLLCLGILLTSSHGDETQRRTRPREDEFHRTRSSQPIRNAYNSHHSPVDTKTALLTQSRELEVRVLVSCPSPMPEFKASCFSARRVRWMTADAGRKSSHRGLLLGRHKNEHSPTAPPFFFFSQRHSHTHSHSPHSRCCGGAVFARPPSRGFPLD